MKGNMVPLWLHILGTTMKVINIKEHMPNSDYAIHLLDEAIHDNKLMDEKVIIVVHGYGSHGVGGVIKSSVMQHFQKLRKEGKIIDFVQGEHWGDSNELKNQLCVLYPELILSSQLYNQNSGVTVVWLQK